ncbi:glycosyltransferase family 9 protein [Paludibaculum fermentans]|uniref:Glycosyltransferase family 9 protein n=1 Tax=Paludibaculum fermentans TaxID=1473598 RepID=A0A7S7NLB4_PALFE|nr:glycosyltransferase family 9 protein [Paludibaculum fermentans]QOY85726.1 glycosyltransferase family 9 protein [Paludibaculum fermentans]
MTRRLILRPGAIGDTLVSLPALESLRTDATELWAPSVNLPLLSHLGSTQSLVSAGVDALRLSPATLNRLARFDDIVSWYGATREDFRAQVQHLPFRFFTALPPTGSTLHAVDYYLDQAGAPLGAIPRLPIDHRPEGFAVIHPFSGGRSKNWPLARFQEVARRLPLPVNWCAGPEETLDEAIRFNDLGALARWLATASLYIGNDSGISHLAAACGVPVVAVFGPTDPAIWAPRGRHVCVAAWDWPPERVAAEASALLTASAGTRFL